jgi:hypothetical protein
MDGNSSSIRLFGFNLVALIESLGLKAHGAAIEVCLSRWFIIAVDYFDRGYVINCYF